eukprot:CAMPEP_0174915172 /NCGR_PEP_ID=MMETSP1355-20121228/617_1 /TAXON_ID=464990 /ORGANISM="Hemiselmis tepida, Strain CCMP443" /LENGTH=70 /DNA_ID=CAMNT_0016160011 /DNA_START=27 /DNA_END=239 /DNA_ORIENTATION=-
MGVLSLLYTAPAAGADYCDSSGCLPGQVPLPSAGLKGKSIVTKSMNAQMDQVLKLAQACKSGRLSQSQCS